MRQVAALCAAIVLASCTFDSEQPLFTTEDAVYPIEDGAVFNWRPYPDHEDLVVRFTRVGAGYEMRPVGDDNERPMRVQFVSIVQTHDDDYIAQLDFTGEGRGMAYAFLFPWGDDRYRVIYEPRAFGDRESQLCVASSFGACTFRSAEDARAYFLTVLYPAWRSGQIPERFIDIGPEGGALPPRPTPSGKPTPQ